METDDFISTHRNEPIFKGLNDDEIKLILFNSHVKWHKKGQILVQQGDIPQYLFYLIEGSLITFRSGTEGNINAIRLLGRGDTCMDAVIFMDSVSPINVQAVQNSQILYIGKAFVEQFAGQSITFAGNIIRIMSRHYKNALYQLDGLSIKSAVQRAGYYLLQKYLTDNSKSFVMPFNRYFVASHLGMSLETLSRAFAHIKELGVEIKGRKVLLADEYALCSFCDESTAAVCRNRTEKCARQYGVQR